jgi:hypothetical protein
MQVGKGQGVDDLIATRNWLAEQPFIEKVKLPLWIFVLVAHFNVQHDSSKNDDFSGLRAPRNYEENF